MATIDIICAIFIILVAIFGLKKGLVMSIIGIFGWIIGIIISLALGPSVSNLLQDLIKISSDIANIIGYIIVFVVVLAILGILCSLIHKSIQFLHLGTIDHLLGFIFGCIKALIIIFVVVFIVRLMPLSKQMENYINSSYIVSFSEKFVNAIIDRTNLKQPIDKMKHKLPLNKDYDSVNTETESIKER